MERPGVNVLALVKGSERFVFLYDDQSAEHLLKTLGDYAADPELSFNWYDAAVLSQRVHPGLVENANPNPIPAPHREIESESRLPE